ncbi:MAG TPA: leucyl aminopeptidase family protein [Chthonomonadaceae bacterium]|nr:leucyl aminopeptidase family protein [Chthonomonadaceae bacterium]
MFDSIEIAGLIWAEAIVLALFEDKQPPSGGGDDAKLFALPAVKQALSRKECTGEADNLVETFVALDGGTVRIHLLGLGERAKFTPETMRKAAARLGRRLAKAKDENVALAFAGTLRDAGADVEHCGRCVGESLGLLAWNGRLYQGAGSKPKPKLPLRLRADDAELARGLGAGLKLAASANLARDLSQTPPNVATPAWMADQARKLAAETGLDCTVIAGHDLVEKRLEGLLNVGRASDHPPCLIRLAYRPEGVDGNARPVVLLGKTITYDTGGLTLKVNNGMVGMKRDKDGGCAVLGAMHAVATLLKPPFPVVGLLVAAENSVSDSSMRPDDVITYRNGVTVEVTNTDAEGRLVLADGLCWACDEEKASHVVDLATLTGGVVTALGSTFAGLFATDEPFAARLEAAAERSGERLWRLPLHAEYREMMKSPVADIINSNPNRKAHPIQGAAFLSYFVPEGTPWAHIDIAGVHAVDADTGPFVKGPTGFGVRLLADLISGMQE